MAEKTAARTADQLRALLIPLAMAQFICSFAGSNMNVMINDISKDLNTTVKGVQVAITLFLLVMAALMIPGGKLTDLYGRTRLFRLGLVIYAVGAILSAASPGLGVLILGNSILEGVGTALLIPPVYILTTLFFTQTTTRARAFGAISGMGGIGAAAGPLIGGVITTTISWRASFVFQALVIVFIVILSRRIEDPIPADPSRPFDIRGSVLSAVGLVLFVMGIMAIETSGWLALGLMLAGALVLFGFYLSIRSEERHGKEPLLSTAVLKIRTANLGLVTQCAQWLLLLGMSFTVATFLQVVRGYDAIQTGVIFTATTAGLLISSLLQERFARRREQRTVIIAGFIITTVGVAALLVLASGSPSPWALAPGLFVIGLGLGVMLTPSVNIVQSSVGDALQGEMSGLSRCISNLGSSLGTAIAGTILVLDLNRNGYAAAMITLTGIGLIGLGAAWLLPRGMKPKVIDLSDASAPIGAAAADKSTGVAQAPG